MVRTPRSDNNGLRKGAWTPEEDSKLIAYVTRYGCWNWRQLPKYAGLARCGKSCRLRWLNYLNPNIKRGNFTPEEDETVIKLHQKLGNKWSAIAAELPGRTDNEIKNHWNAKLKKQIQLNSSVNDPKIAHVSESKGHSDSDPSQSTPATSQKILDDASHLSPPTSSICEASGNVSEALSLDYFACLDEFIEPLSADFWTMADVSNFPTVPSMAEPQDIYPSYDAGLWSEIYDEFAKLC